MIIETVHHDYLAGYVANEHIDWTGASADFETSSTVKAGTLTDGTATITGGGGSGFTSLVVGNLTLAGVQIMSTGSILIDTSTEDTGEVVQILSDGLSFSAAYDNFDISAARGNVNITAGGNSDVVLSSSGLGVILINVPIENASTAGDMIFRNIDTDNDIYFSVKDGVTQRTILFMDASEMRVGINTTSPDGELQVLAIGDISQGGFTFDARLWNGGSPQLLYTNMSLTGAYGIDIESRNSATGISAAGIRMRNDGTVSFMTGNGVASPTAKAAATQKGFDVTGLGVNTTTQTNTDYTALTTDDVILVSTGATSRTITLLAASTVTGKIYHVKKIDTGAGSVIIDADGSELIDGALTARITIQYEAVTIQSDGSNWYIL